MGILIMGVSFLFVGPDQTFTGLDSHLYYTIPSVLLLGFGTAIVLELYFNKFK